MPLNIRIQDPHTKAEKLLTIPDYEEVTLAHWKAFNPLNEDRSDEGVYDSLIRKVCLYTGLSESTVEQWTPHAFGVVLDHVRLQIERADDGSEQFRKALEEGTEFIPDPIIGISGKLYNVPLSMDHDVLIAQFADWERWTPPEHEADLIGEALAFMLVEAGTEYSGASKEKVADMMNTPIEKAFDLCSFFFSRSAAFATVTTRRSQKFRDLTRRLLTDILRTSPTDTEASTFSTGPQN